MQHEYSQKEQDILYALANVISTRRKQTKKSQRIIAFENDIHKSMFSRFESAKNQPMLLSFWKISEALGLKPSELLSLIEQELPDDFTLIDL